MSTPERARASIDPMPAGPAQATGARSTERFVAGFDDLRAVRRRCRRPTSTKCCARPATWPGSTPSSTDDHRDARADLARAQQIARIVLRHAARR